MYDLCCLGEAVMHKVVSSLCRDFRNLFKALSSDLFLSSVGI